jgi:hypothetical protein
VLVAWIFAILGFLWDLFLLLLLWWTIIGAIIPIIGIWVFFTINSIKGAVDRGDAATASRLNTTVFGILALIFDGIIPGILLLVAKGNIDRAASSWRQTTPPPPPTSPPYTTEMYCTYCGARNSVDSKFCNACGKELKKPS